MTAVDIDLHVEICQFGQISVNSLDFFNTIPEACEMIAGVVKLAGEEFELPVRYSIYSKTLNGDDAAAMMGLIERDLYSVPLH